MTILTEVVGSRADEACVGELPDYLSRKVVTVASGEGVLSANTVLGKVTASGKYVELNPAAADGSEVAVAVLYEKTNATSADASAVIRYKDAAYNAGEIVWPAGITAPQKTTAISQLDSVGIVLR